MKRPIAWRSGAPMQAIVERVGAGVFLREFFLLWMLKFVRGILSGRQPPTQALAAV